MKRLLVPSCVLVFAASLTAQTATHRSYDTAFLGPPIAGETFAALLEACGFPKQVVRPYRRT
jgi:hypothetical protein